MNTKNERSKHTKAVRFVWITFLLLSLLLMALGLLFYLLAPATQISFRAENLILLVVSILLLVALFVWKFWYKPISKQIEEYRMESKMLKTLFSRRATVIFIFLSFGISFWYFGHYRPAQEIRNAETVRKYKATPPLSPDTPIPDTSATPPASTPHAVEEETSVKPLVPEAKNVGTFSTPEQGEVPESAELSGEAATPPEKSEVEPEHTHSKAEREASKKLITEAEKALENLKQIQGEGFELLRGEAMPMVADYLNTLSTEEQIEMLKVVKTTMSSQISQYPPEFQQQILEKYNVFEEGWRMYLEMLAEAGYTPPKGFE